jgi:hypothetical protein
VLGNAVVTVSVVTRVTVIVVGGGGKEGGGDQHACTGHAESPSRTQASGQRMLRLISASYQDNYITGVKKGREAPAYCERIRRVL